MYSLEQVQILNRLAMTCNGMGCEDACSGPMTIKVQVTVGLLEEGEVGVVSQINNALLKGGYTKEAAAVGGSTLTSYCTFHLLCSCRHFLSSTSLLASLLRAPPLPDPNSCV